MAIKPYLQLVRLPNVFTAAADSLAGWLLVEGTFAQPRRWVPLVLASACTYAAGSSSTTSLTTRSTASNARHGRCPRAGSAGGSPPPRRRLLAAGLRLAVASGTRHGGRSRRLIACVLGYDAGLKRTRPRPRGHGGLPGVERLARHEPGREPGRAGRPGSSPRPTAVFVTGITWISRSEVETGLRKGHRGRAGLQNSPSSA